MRARTPTIGSLVTGRVRRRREGPDGEAAGHAHPPGVRPIALIGLLAIVAGLVVPADRPAEAAIRVRAAAAPAAWPFDRLEIGFADARAAPRTCAPTRRSGSATSTSRAA